MELFIGILGSGIILIAFLLNQMDIWKNNNFYYDLFNFVGSAILAAYGFALETYPFVVLNTIWALFSLKDLLKRVLR